MFYLNQYMATDAQRGIGMMPRRGLDSTINEVARAYKLNVAKKLVSVIPLKVSRQVSFNSWRCLNLQLLNLHLLHIHL